MKICVVNPTDNSLVSVEEWEKAKNPTAATMVALVDVKAKLGLYVAKDKLERTYMFDEAQTAAAVYRDTVDAEFRNPTCREAVEIFYSRFAGLDKAIRVIGGTPIDSGFCWTCEADFEHISSAFVYCGHNGNAYCRDKYLVDFVRPVATFTIK